MIEKTHTIVDERDEKTLPSTPDDCYQTVRDEMLFSATSVPGDLQWRRLEEYFLRWMKNQRKEVSY